MAGSFFGVVAELLKTVGVKICAVIVSFYGSIVGPKICGIIPTIITSIELMVGKL